jgi:hypothetical protein
MHSDDDREAVMDDVDDDPGFAAWCERMAVGRLKRRLRLGLPISDIGRRTLARFGIPSFAATFVERPDSTGRWALALTLLLDAGREALV